ncbi:hypothetical protein PMAYCL1PPCAC_14197 [Pristionchus mayeri]|uniref:Uncharacterized protein n=1 Tax=Pristionchus mayeri TaxID=1317129 RepID=A0AAN4ZME3_9BILA|nr:hypothetical protein PMAYCL1PPCAC_14197 [Pristionchus mayeri]
MLPLSPRKKERSHFGRQAPPYTQVIRHSFAMQVTQMCSIILSVGVAFAAPVPPSSSEGVIVTEFDDVAKDLRIIILFIIIAIVFACTRFAVDIYLDCRRHKQSPPSVE